ncbi:MAG: hypothetical protein WC523_07385 [Patescibacteria group bacterium]
MINFLLADKDLGAIGTGEGFGAWAEFGDNPSTLLTEIISKILGILTIFAGIWFLFQAIMAGYSYLSAGGDKARIENAWRKLTNALIGLAIVVAAYGLIALLGTFLGVKFLEIGDLLDSISPNGTVTNWRQLIY